jgi:hypothetical protein
MSADNRLCMMEWGDQWFVWHGSCSTNYDSPPASAECFSDRDQAADYMYSEANRLVFLEGGSTVIGPPEQQQALIDIITDATRRLNNLRRYGDQNFRNE